MDDLDFSVEGMSGITGLNVVAPFKDQYGTVYSSETEAARLSGLPVRLVMAALRSGEMVKGWKFTFVD